MGTAPQLMPKNLRWSIALAVIMTALGLLAIALPMRASFAVMLVVGWFLVFSGVTQGLYALKCEGIGRTAWEMLIALLYLFVGAYVITHPLRGLASLAFIIGYFFFLEGVATIATYFQYLRNVASSWLIFSGVLRLMIGVAIWRHWLAGSFEIIGILVGIDILANGIGHLLMARNVRWVEARR